MGKTENKSGEGRDDGKTEEGGGFQMKGLKGPTSSVFVFLNSGAGKNGGWAPSLGPLAL